MTIASTARKAGPLLGNGSATAFPFAFKVFSSADIQVVVADGAGVETVLALGTDYTVALNPNQETSPGGTVNYPVSGPPMAGTGTLSIIGDIDYDQPLDLPSGGNYSPLALENQLDRIAMQVQQLKEIGSRAVKLPVTSTEDADALVADLARVADSADNLDTVASNIADVNAVAAAVSDVATVAENLVNVANFADVYLGAKTSDPATRNDGSGLVVGDIYFNTSSAGMRVYSLGGWLAVGVATPVTIVPQSFSGNGSTTTFTLPTAPPFEAACDVYISGVAQTLGADYYIVGSSLVFASAPPAGTDNIYTKTLSPYGGGVPHDGSVTPQKVSPGTYGIDITGNAATADTVNGLTIAASGAMGVPTVSGAFSNLKLSATGTDPWVHLTADALVLHDPVTDTYVTGRNLSLSAATNITGATSNGIAVGGAAVANSWYAVWVRWNGSSFLLSLTLDGALPPAGFSYTHYARVGWIRTDGTVFEYPLPFSQAGPDVEYMPSAGSNLTGHRGLTAGASVGNASLVAFVPPTAGVARVMGQSSGSSHVVILIGSSPLGDAAHVFAFGMSSTVSVFTAPVDVVIRQSPRAIYVNGQAATNTFVRGWRDNL